jgi:hypothetical protein
LNRYLGALEAGQWDWDTMIARGIVLIVAIIICTTVGRATVVDLTGSNDSGTINGAQFVFTTPQPTGTGVIQPFLRLENSPVEQGYKYIWRHSV